MHPPVGAVIGHPAFYRTFAVFAVGSDAFIAPVIAAGNDAAGTAAGGIRGCLPTGWR